MHKQKAVPYPSNYTEVNKRYLEKAKKRRELYLYIRDGADRIGPRPLLELKLLPGTLAPVSTLGPLAIEPGFLHRSPLRIPPRIVPEGPPAPSASEVRGMPEGAAAAALGGGEDGEEGPGQGAREGNEGGKGGRGGPPELELEGREKGGGGGGREEEAEVGDHAWHLKVVTAEPPLFLRVLEGDDE